VGVMRHEFLDGWRPCVRARQGCAAGFPASDGACGHRGSADTATSAVGRGPCTTPAACRYAGSLRTVEAWYIAAK